MKKVKNKNKKKMMGVAAALALTTMLAGTFAWVTYQDERINRVKTAVSGQTVLNENWDNPGEITPGMEAKKEVSVTNTGTAPVFVRVSYEEVLTHLISLGEESKIATGWKTDDEDAPVEFNTTSVLEPANKYIDITDKVTGVPDGVVVWAKGEAVKNPSTGNTETSFEAQVAWKYQDTPTKKYQKMDAKITIDPGVNTAGTTAEDWTYTVADMNYYVYKDGYTMVGFDWAGKKALLGEGPITRYGVEADYRELAGTLVTTPTDAEFIPTTNGDAKNLQADTTALGKDAFKVVYGNDLIDVQAVLANDKWVYNSEDGYFYWTSALVGGETTKDLLKKLTYGTDGGKPYTNITFDLIVAMEAIQVTKEALTDDAGWSMNTANPLTSKIFDQLVASGGL